jgi:Tfp pilus assembly protein PilF
MGEHNKAQQDYRSALEADPDPGIRRLIEARLDE